MEFTSVVFPQMYFFLRTHDDFVELDHDTTGLWLRSVLLSSQKYYKEYKVVTKAVKRQTKNS